MKRNKFSFGQELLPDSRAMAGRNTYLPDGGLYLNRSALKKAVMVCLVCLFTFTVAGAQDSSYYQDDQSSVTVQAQQAPPPLPDYVQPPCPGDGYLWTPGYWSWATDGYYWVPGVWVMPPAVNLLWTPGYWGFYGAFYGWHPGYWGLNIGYYGGVNYGFGYWGSGFYGGRWENGHFSYNTSVWHVGKDMRYTYAGNKMNAPGHMSRASFNGPGGVQYRPDHNEMTHMREDHVPAIRAQMDHEQSMGGERGQFHIGNARPAIHSMSMPGGQRFDERGRMMNMGGMRSGGGGRGGRR